MDRINFNNNLTYDANSHFVSQYKLNQRIRESFVTKLEPHHLPDKIMSIKISLLLDLFCCSDSIKETIKLKKEILNELHLMHEDISATRSYIFNIVNKNSDHVYGVLKNGFTASDRDLYIRKLMCYHEVKCKITELTHTHHEGHFLSQYLSLVGTIALLFGEIWLH